MSVIVNVPFTPAISSTIAIASGSSTPRVEFEFST